MFCKGCIVVVCCTLFISPGFSQISRVTLNLTNSFDRDANLNSNYRQNYQLLVMGNLFNEKLGDFALLTAFANQRSLRSTGPSIKTSLPTLWNYNFRGNVLKTSRFPLNFSIIRSRREHQADPILRLNRRYENNDFIRLQGSLPGNGILPKIVYNTNFSQLSDQNDVSQMGRQFSIAVNNQSKDVTAGYSMSYSKSSDYAYDTKVRNAYESASFSSFTRLFDKVRLTAQANLNNLNAAQSSLGKINIIPDSKSGHRHNTTLSLQNQSTSVFSTQKLNVVHSSSFIIPGGKRLSLGADLSESNSSSQFGPFSERSGFLRANFLINKRINKVRTSLTLSERTGAQKLSHQEKLHFVNTFNASGRARWKLNKKVELKGEESITHSLNYLSNSNIRNTLNLGVQSNLNSYIYLDFSIIEGYARNGLANRIYTTNSRTLKGRSDLKLGRTTVSTLETTLSWSNLEKPLDRAWSSRFTISNSGILRGVTAQFSSFYSHQTISTGVDPSNAADLIHFSSYNLNANLSARFYAYRILVRYDYKQSKFSGENRYFISISRPISILR